MKTISKFVLKMLIPALFAVSCTEKQQDAKADEKAIRGVMEAYQDAFNHKNASKLASLWSSAALYENPLTGVSAEGRESIAKLFSDQFELEKNTKIEIQIKDITFSSNEEAIETGIMKIVAPDQKTQEIAYRVSFVREKDEWLIDAIKELELQVTSSNFEHLRELAWMEGKWINQDENVQIVFKCQWDKYKNFLTQHFSMAILGENSLEGQQIIAWDPVQKKIKSWVFDSNGGFGQGTWEKLGKSWYVSMKYTLNDGGVGYSKNVYTPLNEHAYTFASIEREVDGEIMPNIDPIKVDREQ